MKWVLSSKLLKTLAVAFHHDERAKECKWPFLLFSAREDILTSFVVNALLIRKYTNEHYERLSSWEWEREWVEWKYTVESQKHSRWRHLRIVSIKFYQAIKWQVWYRFFDAIYNTAGKKDWMNQWKHDGQYRSILSDSHQLLRNAAAIFV